MATTRWLGRALAVAKVMTHTIGGAAAAAQTYTITRNGKSISYTSIGGDTNTTIATALTTLLNASTVPEFSEVTWSSAAAIITGTCDTAGNNQTYTTTTDGAWTFVTALVTAASGPNRWDVAVNWSGGAVPVGADDVVIDIPVSILDGLDQSAVTLTSLVIAASFDNAYIGRPRTNAGGYTEDRDIALKISATTVRIGVGEGNGSGRVKINFGTVQMTTEVRKTGQPIEQGVPSLLLLGTHASNAMDVQAGSVGVAIFGTEVSTLLTLRCSANATVTCGEGCTLGTISGEGTVQMNSAVTTLTQAGGQWTINGSSAITTLTQNGGLLNHNSSSTITTATIGGTVNCGGDASARTITTCTLNKGGKIVDPLNVLTITNGIQKASNVREIAAN